MKKTFFYCCFAIGIIFNCKGQEANGSRTEAEPGAFRVASYNIRYEAPADEQTGNGWGLRKGPLASLILRHDFDIVGTQEGNARQLAELKELLPGYAYSAKPYGGPDGHLSNCAMFYKAALFEMADSGVFWFSETPEEPSIGWDATDSRICHWIRFREKATSRTFFFFNVHFYWRYHIAREKSGPLLVKKIKEIAGEDPVICTGDFNSASETTQISAVKELLSDAYRVTEAPRSGKEGTSFSGGIFQGEPKGRIDYIFVSDDFVVKDYKVLSDTYGDNRYPSDHLPVTSLLKWSD